MKNLNELEKVVDKDSLEKCFIEYMLTAIGKAKRLDCLESGTAVMDEDELDTFRERIRKAKDKESVRITLVALGYDEKWVNSSI